mgnify:CR=1 FL=1
MAKEYGINFPGHVKAGVGSVSHVAQIVEELQATEVLLVASGDVYKAGLLDDMIESLSKCNLTIIHDAPDEPEYQQVLSMFHRVKDQKPQVMIAAGGGSVMDAVKLLAVLVNNEAYENDLFDVTRIEKRYVTTVFIPTSAGTGAEATPNAIVVVPEKELKIGIISHHFIPDHVILDPVLTKTMPAKVTAATGLDAFCHCIECFISKKGNPLSDLFALKGIQLIKENLLKAFVNGDDIEARENMLLAAFYGGLSIASSGVVAIHALSYPLGGKYRIPHGVSNAILLPHVIDFNQDAILKPLKRIAVAMKLPADGKTDEEVGQLVVDEIYQLNRDLQMPNNLGDFGITEKDLDGLVINAAGVTRLLDNNPKAMSHQDIRNIYLKLLD